MHILDPFSTPSLGNRSIIVATDYLTRYAETKAVPRGTTTQVASFFVHDIGLRYGAHAVLISDRGAAFTAELLREITLHDAR